MSTHQPRVAIVGSGFGGLSLAVRLQSQGYKVTVYEKQDMVGGHAYQLKKDGYTFDLGPSLITAPSIIREIFEIADRKLEDYLELIPLEPFYRIYYHDKTYLDYSGDSDTMKKEISKFSEKDAQRYDDFMKYSARLYQLIIKDKLGSKPFLGFKEFFQALPQIVRTRSFLSAYDVVKGYFEHPNIRFAYSFHPLFIGGNPFITPALYLMIPYLEREEGVWFSRGGMYSMVEALRKLFEEKGGVIKVSTPVEQITTDNGRVTGVVTKDGEENFDLVVSNADLHHTYSKLLSEYPRKFWTDKRLKSKKYSMSSFLLYLGTKKQYPQLLHHTLILSHRYKELVEDIFGEKSLPDDFSMYLHVPTRTDPGMAPEGCESMYVLIPVPNLKADTDWSTEKEIYTKKILDFLQYDFGMDDLQENIEVMETYTPDDFADQRNNYLGAAWGLQPKLLQSANFRAHNRSEEIPNLYLVGASVHPGAGVPGVMLTAETTETLILEDFPIAENGEN